MSRLHALRCGRRDVGDAGGPTPSMGQPATWKLERGLSFICSRAGAMWVLSAVSGDVIVLVASCTVRARRRGELGVSPGGPPPIDAFNNSTARLDLAI